LEGLEPFHLNGSQAKRLFGRAALRRRLAVQQRGPTIPLTPLSSSKILRDDRTHTGIRV